MVGVIGDFSEDPELAAGIARGVEVARHEYNAETDSTYVLSIQRFDTKGSAEATTQTAEELLGIELLIGVVGPNRADEVRLAAPPLAGAQIPFLIPSVTDGDLSANGWTSFRRLVADDHREGLALGKQLIGSIRGGKSAIFHDGSEAGKAFAEGVKAAFEEAQLPPIHIEGITSKRPDYAALAAPVVAANPASVFYGGAPDRAGALLIALRASGFKGKFIGSHSIRNADFAKLAGPSGEETLAACVCADVSDPRLRSFNRSFEGRFSGAPPPYAAEAYEGAWMLFEAIEEVEPRPRTITRFFGEARSFQGNTKRYEYDQIGELRDPPVWVYQLKDGKWNSIGRTSASK